MKEQVKSIINRENDIKKIIVYLAEQYVLCKENLDKANVYTECINLLNKWINHQDIEEIKSIKSQKRHIIDSEYAVPYSSEKARELSFMMWKANYSLNNTK